MSLGGGGEVIGEERTRETPASSEAGVKTVENADCEGDGLDGDVCAAENSLDERDGGGGQGG